MCPSGFARHPEKVQSSPGKVNIHRQSQWLWFASRSKRLNRRYWVLNRNPSQYCCRFSSYRRFPNSIPIPMPGALVVLINPWSKNKPNGDRSSASDLGAPAPDAFRDLQIPTNQNTIHSLHTGHRSLELCRPSLVCFPWALRSLGIRSCP
jgi:hypothetical protein